MSTRFIAVSNQNVPHKIRPHFVPMQTGPAKVIDFPVGQTDAARQLDASDEAEHIHPNFKGDQNDFSEF
jgi:hypothetical protein